MCIKISTMPIFVKYEHLGSVQQPALGEDDQIIEYLEADSSVNRRFVDLVADDVFQRFGIDFNVVFDLSDDNRRALPVL